MPTLDWRHKDDATRAVAKTVMKILRERPELGYGERTGGNLLVQGDNLEALKALLPFAAGSVKCVYIDPPYNTGSAFEHYDDNVEHATWLSMMYPRLELLRDFLSEDGSIWISIDDREGAYLRVICDEIFGRENFVSNISWQRTYSTRNDSKGIVNAVEHILVYSKREGWQPKKLPRTEEMDKKYKNPDGDFASWRNSDAFAPGASTHQGMVYAVQNPFTGKMVYPSKNRCWPIEQAQLLAIMNQWCPYELKDLGDEKERADVCGITTDEVRKGVFGIVLSKGLDESLLLAEAVYAKGPWPKFFFNKHGQGTIARKTYLENVGGVPPSNLFLHEDVGHTDEAKKEVLKVFDGKSPFATPKPERLIQRILTIATDEGDLVMDSFLGSGTTAAVAMKMGRRFIGIEMGEHAKTHCALRLKKVVDGEQGGISESAKWKGGGGFRFCELGEPLLDERGAIRETIPYETLAAHIWWQETGRGWGVGARVPRARVSDGDGHANGDGGGHAGRVTLPGDGGHAGRVTLPGDGGHAGRVTLPSTVIGIDGGVAYALLYNGILHERSVGGGNVLTGRTLAVIKEDLGETKYRKLVVYGEWTKLGDERLAEERIEFRQTPYDVVRR